MATECRIRCRARSGLFADECVVRLQAVCPPDREEKEVSCLAYGSSIEKKGDADQQGEYPAELHAYRIAETETHSAVVLPQPTFENGASILVRSDHVIVD